MNWTDYLRTGDVSCPGDFVIADSQGNILMATCFDRSAAKVKSALMSMMAKTSTFRSCNYRRVPDVKYKYSVKSIYHNYDRMSYGVISTEAVGETYLLTTGEFQETDVYSFLMNNYTLPLLREWTVPLFEQLKRNHHVYGVSNPVQAVDMGRTFRIHGKAVTLSDIRVYEWSLSQKELEDEVSALLKSKAIFISRQEIPEMQFESFDGYITKYGQTLVKKLEEQITPLTPLKGTVDGLALKEKRLYPQQAACVNGMTALKRAGRKFGLMVEGMGVGKTIQGMSATESYFMQKKLSSKLNPDADKDDRERVLAELYRDSECLDYRNLIMCPGHLVEKWKEEILSEIPYARVTVLEEFSQLVHLRERGKKREGCEFYIMGMDKAKLGTSYSPIPNKVVKMRPTVNICMDCLEESIMDESPDKLLILKKKAPFERYELSYRSRKEIQKGDRCERCGGNRFHSYILSEKEYEGMICPHCGELLARYPANMSERAPEETIFKSILQPKHFAGKNSSNSVCYHCGGNLWGYDCKPVGGKPTPSPWKILKYFPTARKDEKKMAKAWVLKGYENTFTQAYEFGKPKLLEHEYGIRRYAPERFIKKYLKGYFDFCILDEVHKFEGFSSARANAAHSFIKCSKFTLGLTGTISNGSAASFFSLLYRLNPGKMKSLGYEFDEASLMAFTRKYGTVETVYEDDGSGSYNRMSRGKVIHSAKIKPGISPLLFIDFLMECSVFLDLSDLSKYLPPLKEEVVLCDMPEDVLCEYQRVNRKLKDYMYTKEGAGAMTDILQFGLSFPDKPYGRAPITSTKVEDFVLTEVANFEKYSDPNNLLPKEQKLVELVNKEIGEGRNCFVFASFTGTAETNVTGRLQEIIEKNCNLKGRVEILRAEKPGAAKREDYIHKRAAEGVKVFICNPKIVETGLDFCFKYKGKFFNYPSIIFYQISYELAVIWQASRRHYRLNQTEECRTYWMAYSGTLQATALNIMAQKQVAASAIQGKFSTEGLATLAKGVDARVQLAQALSKGDMSSRESLENMFDVMAAANGGEEDERYANYEPPKTFYELTGIEEGQSQEWNGFDTLFDKPDEMSLFEMLDMTVETAEVPEEMVEISMEDTQAASMDLFTAFFAGMMADTEMPEDIRKEDVKAAPKATKKRKQDAGQLSLMDLLAM